MGAGAITGAGPAGHEGRRGLTLIEIVVALVVAAILSVSAAAAVGRYGRKSVVSQEASKVVDGLWELRASATTGVVNPCMDFPDSLTVRLYRDAGGTPDGFGAGDVLIRTWTYRDGVTARAISGGRGPTHFVCFEARGVTGSSTAPLRLDLEAGELDRKSVRLLPATGMARVQ